MGSNGITQAKIDSEGITEARHDADGITEVGMDPDGIAAAEVDPEGITAAKVDSEGITEATAAVPGKDDAGTRRCGVLIQARPKAGVWGGGLSGGRIPLLSGHYVIRFGDNLYQPYASGVGGRLLAARNIRSGEYVLDSEVMNIVDNPLSYALYVAEQPCAYVKVRSADVQLFALSPLEEEGITEAGVDEEGITEARAGVDADGITESRAGGTDPDGITEVGAGGTDPDGITEAR